MKLMHRMPFGAEILEPGRTRFRLWAPSARDVTLVLARQGGAEPMPMAAGRGGWRELVTGDGSRLQLWLNLALREVTLRAAPAAGLFRGLLSRSERAMR